MAKVKLDGMGDCGVELNVPEGSYLDKDAEAEFTLSQFDRHAFTLTVNKEQARKIGNMFLDFGGIKCECEGCTYWPNNDANV